MPNPANERRVMSNEMREHKKGNPIESFDKCGKVRIAPESDFAGAWRWPIWGELASEAEVEDDADDEAMSDRFLAMYADDEDEDF